MNYKYFFSYIFLLFFFYSQAQCEQLYAGDDVTVNCSNNVTTLTAEVFPGIGAATDTYDMQMATPCPLPPSGGYSPTGITVDDVWSPIINLPFTFYFFGQPYTQIIIGANGVVSFSTNLPNQTPTGFCPWSFSASLPSTALFKNTIFGAYHDVDVSVPNGGTIEYYISGAYPQRKFVISYENVAHYQCNNLRTTQRVVLYETSNVIDVQIDRKDTCSSWNQGNAVIGIQNLAGDVAYVPPGRNTGPWSVPAAQPELWRFTPNHNPANINFTYTWYDDTTNTVVGTGPSVTVAPTATTDYRVEAEFDDPNNGQHYTLVDMVTVFFDDDLGQPDLGPDIQQCANTPISLDGTTTNALTYQWQKDGVDIPGATTPTYDVTQTGTYTVIVTNGVCEKSDDIFVEMEEVPIVDVGNDFHECEGNTATLTATVANASGNETYQWQKDGVDIPGATTIDLDVSETGIYTINVTNTLGCVGSDDVEVVFDEMPDLELGEDMVICPYDFATIVSNVTDADTYTWEINGQVSSNTTDTFIIDIPGDYDVTLTLVRGTCTASDSIHVTILDPVTIQATPILYGELDIEAQGGLPPYQYSLDGVNYDESGHFSNLPNGDYPVYVKDANGCVYELPPVHVINLIFPQFFTPNGDGYNDVWRVENAENTPDAQINIYNRYGKVIKRMHTNAYEFWDGTYNGKPLMATDYWFILTLPDGKTYKGHFAMKR